MAITYSCTKCGARMTLDGPVDTLKCPVCKIAMTEERASGGGIETNTGLTPSSVHTPYRTTTPARTFQGLKVARPIRKFGEMSDTGSKPLPPPIGSSVAPIVQPPPVGLQTDTGGGMAAAFRR